MRKTHTHTHTPTHCTLAYCTHTVHSPGNGYPFIQSLHQRTFLRPTDTHLAAFLFNFQFGFYFTARNFVGPSNSKFVRNLQRGNFKFETFKDSSPALKPLFFFKKKVQVDQLKRTADMWFLGGVFTEHADRSETRRKLIGPKCLNNRKEVNIFFFVENFYFFF